MPELHSFQTYWLERIRQATGNVLIVGPTGCGKTVVAVQLMREGRVLFVAHSRELIQQTEARCREWGILDTAVILAGRKRNPSARVQIASKQTLARGDLPSADVVIFDEAQHIPSAGWLRLFDHYRAAGAKIYGLTATPIRLDGAELGEYFHTLCQAPPASELAARGILATPRVWVPAKGDLDLSQVSVKDRDFNQRELSGAVRKRGIVGSLVQHWKDLGGNRQTVVYAVDVAHAQTVAERFREEGISADVVSGKTETARRDAMLADFSAGKLKVLVNCQILTEGWDCPAARCVVFARPTLSLALALQMVGRITRAGETPRLLDLVGNVPHFALAGYDLTGDNRFELSADKACLCVRDPANRVKICPECREVLGCGVRVCQCGHVFWEAGAPEEEPGDLEEWFPSRGLTERQIDEICERYPKGESSYTLGKAFGTTRDTIIRHLKARGCRVRSRPANRGRLTENQIDEVCERYPKGESSYTLGKAFGVDKTTITKYLKKRGVRVRGSTEAQGGLTESQIVEVCERYPKGESSDRLGQAFGVSGGTILWHLKRQGVLRRGNVEAASGLTESQIVEVCERYPKGESSDILGQAFGVSGSVILKYLKARGVPRRAAGRVRLNDVAAKARYARLKQ